MIDEVIQEAETHVEHLLHVLEAYKSDKRLLEKNIERFSLKLEGWEAYLKVLQVRRGIERS